MGSTPRGISGSRGAAVLGLSEYQSPFEVWQRICEERRPGFNVERGYTPPDEPDNAAIRWGTAFEDAIVELASAKVGECKIIDRERLFAWGSLANAIEPILQRNGVDFTAGIPEITCHIDGRYDDCDDGIGTLHEGKTTSLFAYWDSWGTPGTDRIPQGYQIQVQHQMLCTGASEAIVSVLVFPRRVDEWESEGWRVHGPLVGNIHYELEKWNILEKVAPDILRNSVVETGSCREWSWIMAQMGLFHQYPVAASPSLQRMLVEAYAHFWHTYVLPEKEPDITAYADLQRAFPAPVGTIIVSEQEEAWLSERRMITEEIGASGRLGKRKEELRVLTLNSIRSRIGRDSVIDTESQDKVVFVDSKGKRLGSYDGKTFR